jgi:TRAP-type C4-dicarboxylate transport system substrate-binding protein
VWLYFANHYEPMNYIVETNAMANVHVTLMNEESWNQLPEDLQNILMEAAQEAESYNNTLDEQAGANAAQKMKESGIEIYSPTESEFQEWKRLGVEIWPEFIGEDGISRQLVQDTLDAQNYSVPVEF